MPTVALADTDASADQDDEDDRLKQQARELGRLRAILTQGMVRFPDASVLPLLAGFLYFRFFKLNFIGYKHLREAQKRDMFPDMRVLLLRLHRDNQRKILESEGSSSSGRHTGLSSPADAASSEPRRRRVQHVQRAADEGAGPRPGDDEGHGELLGRALRGQPRPEDGAGPVGDHQPGIGQRPVRLPAGACSRAPTDSRIATTAVTDICPHGRSMRIRRWS